MKMVKFIFAVILCAFSFTVSAQQVFDPYTNDAVRYSQWTTPAGTARFIGLGGANTSLGGDISSISGNPAGLGFFNRSAWSISPVLRVGNFNANYQGSGKNTMGMNVQIPNAGVVFHKRFEEYAGSRWISGTFGIGWNQNTSFYNNIDYQGTVSSDQPGLPPFDFVESALQPFFNEQGALREFTNGAGIDEFAYSSAFTELAYETFLLDTYTLPSGNIVVDRYDRDPNTGEYATTSVQQTESILRTGGMTSLDLSYGANYNDKIFLGAALNIHFLNVSETRTFREDPDNNILNYLELSERKDISGAGAGLTIGAIYKPINMVNIGLSYTTPTFISISETQEISLTAFYVADLAENWEIVNEVPAYSFIIPQKLSGGATVFLNKYGFVTADVEWIDYAAGTFNSTDGAFEGQEPDLNNDLKSAINVRLGAEGRLDMFRLRAGYAYFDNPYRNLGLESFEQGRSMVSGGVGIFKKGFSADLTYSLSTFNNPNIQAYPGSDVVSSESSISSFRLTLGKTF